MGVTNRETLGEAEASAETPAIKPTEPTKTDPEGLADFRSDDGSIDVDKLSAAYLAATKGAADGAEEAQPAAEEGDLQVQKPEAEEASEDGSPFSDEELNTWAAEFSENGGLSDETYATLKERGFPKQLVDSWLAGQQALAAAETQQGVELVGGQENYSKMAEWAQGNLSDAEREAFNAAVAQPGATRTNAINGLWARYSANAGPGRKVHGPSGSEAGLQPFRSTAEMTAAMKDKRYGRDSAYTKDVERRVAGMR